MKSILRMVGVGLAFVLALVAGAATAQASDAELATPDEIREASRDMFVAYTASGAAAMLELEQQCWKTVTPGAADHKRVVSLCASSALAGMLIEATFARSQGRSLAPAYNPETIAMRVEASAKLPESELTPIRARSIQEEYVSAIILGLADAGLR